MQLGGIMTISLTKSDGPVNNSTLLAADRPAPAILSTEHLQYAAEKINEITAEDLENRCSIEDILNDLNKAIANV